MNKKNTVKVLLDIVMVMLMVLMFNKRVISMKFHEVGGLVLCGLIVCHLVLNYKWIFSISKKLFDKKLKLKTRIGYWVNMLLFLNLIFIGVSGILISKTIFRGIASDNMLWKLGHFAAAGYTLILMGVHVGLHWQWVRGMAKKVIHIPEQAKKPLGVICLILLVGTGVYSMATTSFTRWLSIPFTAAAGVQHDSPHEQQGQPAHEGGSKGGENGGQQIKGGQSQRGEMHRGEGKGENRPGGSKQEISASNILIVIVNFLSIIGSIGVLTVWIEGLIKRRA